MDLKDSLDSFYFEGGKSIDEVIDDILQNEVVRDFIYKNDLTHDQVVYGINHFLMYIDDTFVNSEGLRESKSMPGFVLKFDIKDGVVSSKYTRIKPLPKSYNKIKTIALLDELTKSSLDDFQLTSEERRSAYNYARRFINSFDDEKQMKGMYISGQFRSGKTFLATAIANEIAEKGYNVVEVYYPELSGLIKGSFQSNNDDDGFTYQEIVSELKGCSLLILDDFGGEAVNPYIRDEILGVVLNYRMIKNKPVIFTSNIPIKLLSDTALRKDGSAIEKTKALRIIERIREIAEEIPLDNKFENKYIL